MRCQKYYEDKDGFQYYKCFSAVFRLKGDISRLLAFIEEHGDAFSTDNLSYGEVVTAFKNFFRATEVSRDEALFDAGDGVTVKVAVDFGTTFVTVRAEKGNRKKKIVQSIRFSADFPNAFDCLEFVLRSATLVSELIRGGGQ